MTDANIFQIMGLAYSSIGLGMLINPRFYAKMLNKMIDDEAVLFLTGFLVEVLGYFLIAYHNIWTGGWTIIITITGWLAMLKGIMMVVIPEKSVRLYNFIKIARGQMKAYGIAVLVLGAVFFYLGIFIA
jgi:hypothetical protein